ncbi:MAG TPA: GNAT family protein [Candidatus Polarisedimenticolia bacterium]|nr:GNAT family protein [Candidatus Polarisedimenticolia bacterium]
MDLTLETCRIRSWRLADAPSLARHANGRGVWLNVRDRFPHPYTLADADRWIRRAVETTPETQFAIVVGEAVGGIGLEPKTDVERRSAEIGYWLGEPFWGRGIATEAVRAMTDFAFTHFDLCRLEALVFEWNPASARVLEKAGYQLEGRLRKSVLKDGRMIDSLLYAIIREPLLGP